MRCAFLITFDGTSYSVVCYTYQAVLPALVITSLAFVQELASFVRCIARNLRATFLADFDLVVNTDHFWIDLPCEFVPPCG